MGLIDGLALVERRGGLSCVLILRFTWEMGEKGRGPVDHSLRSCSFWQEALRLNGVKGRESWERICARIRLHVVVF